MIHINHNRRQISKHHQRHHPHSRPRSQSTINPLLFLFIQQIIKLLIQQLIRQQQQPNNIVGSHGDDTLKGTRRNDHLFGRDGNDQLYGGAGNDVLHGGKGNDVLSGGSGNDRLHVGEGSNIIIGGAGTDTAIINGKPTDYQYSLNHGQLTIKDLANNTSSILSGVEQLNFTGIAGQSFSPQEIINNPFFSDRKDFMLYGDPALNRMVIMKLSTFENVDTFPINGQKVYSADHVTDDKAYIMPRGSHFIQRLDRQDNGQFLPGKKINLPFNPRTGAKNKKLGLELISGSDKPMFALIDIKTDQLVASGGRNEVTKGTFDNYDSQWASGHAVWISDNQFLLPDRQTKELSLYRVDKDANSQWQVTKTDSVITSSSIHTFTHKHSNDPNPQSHLIYASMEGINSSRSNNGGLLEVGVVGDQIQLGRLAPISAGTHHPGLHPNGQHVYVPTADGKLNIIDRDSMTTVKTLNAGKGAGHVVFVPEKNLALIVNHNDTFMTAINMTTHEKIKDIPVARDSPDFNTALQAHTGRVSPDKKYFYNFATDSGTFFRLNLETLAVDKEIYVGGTPKQAAQPGELK
ncbi:MAG: hypothetical protein KAH22_01340 [Thiotrichaceae bacterium]|nr:hypothetical protein [Thiotrichaceae bacterium]